MVFGLEEQDSENLHDKVQQVFAEIKEKPQFEESRVGKNKSGSDGTARPVK